MREDGRSNRVPMRTVLQDIIQQPWVRLQMLAHGPLSFLARAIETIRPRDFTIPMIEGCEIDTFLHKSGSHCRKRAFVVSGSQHFTGLA